MDSKDKEIVSQLEALGVKRLAEALYTLAGRSETVSTYVEMLISPPQESTARIQENLESLLCEDYFYDYHESAELAKLLAGILDDIQINVKDPMEGLQIMKSFFETDEAILEKCDDSDAYVADVYLNQATDLFVAFASDSEDKALVADILFELYMDSGYGVRSKLLSRATEYLDEALLRKIVAAFEALATASNDVDFGCHHALEGIEVLAKQLKDPLLFEKTRLRIIPNLSIFDCIDIAQEYHECGLNTRALEWIEQIEEDSGWYDDERDTLLYNIYLQDGNMTKAEEIAWRMFHRGRTKERFERLLKTVGEEQRDKILFEQTTSLLNSKTFQLEDAAFLVDMGKMKEAGAYLIRWAHHLEGSYYYHIYERLADELEIHEEYLAVTVIYRCLLQDILKQGKSKAYHHGVNYLHKLDALAEKIADWQSVPSHAEFKQKLTSAHKRKWSFWKTYENRS